MTLFLVAGCQPRTSRGAATLVAKRADLHPGCGWIHQPDYAARGAVQSIPGYMTPLRTWSTVHVAGLLLTALPHLQDLTNEMPSGDLVVCKQSNAAFSCALGQGKSPSYMTCHITGAHITGY